MKFLFYLQYAARNLWRNRRWSMFAVFSVAAGVAAVVALRSLGLAIADSLTENIRSSNHGDLALSTSDESFMGFAVDDPEESRRFSNRQLDAIRNWVSEHDGEMVEYVFGSSIQVTKQEQQIVGRPQFVSSFYINPETYPPTQDIYASDPAGVPLRDLFTGGNEIVISQNLADSQQITVGDMVRVSGTEEQFLVRGIVPTSTEAGIRNLFSAFFGFAYFDVQLAQAEVVPVDPQPNRINIILPDGTPLEEIERLEHDLFDTIPRSGPWVEFESVPEILEENQFIGDMLGRFIVTMGLGAMLLGGVGIINTMLVMVRRRTEEIAALKTFGLKGRQVALLFMAEAFWLGLVGSLLGGVFGVILSAITNNYGATLIQQPLRWRIYPEAILFGLVIGLIVSIVFGVLPVLTAARIRPAIILRPNETHIPAMGCLHSIFALLFIVVSLGLIAGQILGHILFGMIGVAVTLIVFGLLICVLWVVVWLVGKMPSFGSVDLRLALRNLSTRRLRTATTLLALSAGMFALSSIAFFGAGVREILQFTLTETFGGNVMIFSMVPGAMGQTMIDTRLNTLEGIEYRTRISMESGRLTMVDGRDLDEPAPGVDVDEIRRQISEAAEAGDFDRVNELSAQLPGGLQTYMQIMVRDTDNPNPTGGELVAGRYLTLEDRGKNVALVRLSPSFNVLNLQVGSTITLDIGSRAPMTFEVVGLLAEIDPTNIQAAFNGDIQIPPGVLPNNFNQFQLNLAQVSQEHLNEVLLNLSSMPLVFSFDISFIDGLLSRFIEQFSALPILVGLLSLGAASVIMANTVALATLERRRQIGILKAIGLKGRRVLRVMLLENTLVSLLGGILGIGLSALGVVIMSFFGLEEVILIPRSAWPVAIALVLSAVAIGAAATFLSASMAVRERVLNVLRYE